MQADIKERIQLLSNGEIPKGYVQTKIGVLPKSWEITHLKNKFDRITNKNKTNKQNVLTISAQAGLISQEEFFNKIVASDVKTNYFVLNKGDFAYNKSYSNGYPFGAIKVLTKYETGVVSPLYICFRPNEKNKVPEFYEHYFESGMFDREIHAIAQEGARNHGLLNIGIEDFFNAYIPDFDYKEQQKIADILSTWDKAIELKELLIEQKKEQKRGLMKKLLTGEVRLPGFEGEWEEVRLGSIVEKIIDNRGKTPPLEESGYELIEISALEGDTVFPKHDRVTKFVDKNTYDTWFRNGNPKKKDILIATVGSVGTSVIMDSNECSIAQNIIAIRLNDSVNEQYIFWMLNSSIFETYIRAVTMGAVQPSIKVPHLLEFKFKIPSLDETKKISSILMTIGKTIEMTEQEVSALKLQKKGLMQLLLTGIVRVNI